MSCPASGHDRSVGIVVRPPGRFFVAMVGEVVEHLLDDGQCPGPVVRDCRDHSGVSFEARRAAELLDRDLDTGELFDHRRPVHERVAVGGHDDEVHEPEQEGRAGDRRPVDDREGGDHTGAPCENLRDASPSGERGNALVDIGSRARQDRDEGEAFLERGAGCRLEHGGGRRREWRAALDMIELHDHHSPVADRAHTRLRRTG